MEESGVGAVTGAAIYAKLASLGEEIVRDRAAIEKELVAMERRSEAAHNRLAQGFQEFRLAREAHDTRIDEQMRKLEGEIIRLQTKLDPIQKLFWTLISTGAVAILTGIVAIARLAPK